MLAVSEGTRVALVDFDEVVSAMRGVKSRRVPSIWHAHLLGHRSRQFTARTTMCAKRAVSLTLFNVKQLFAARCVGGVTHCVCIGMRVLTTHARGIH